MGCDYYYWIETVVEYKDADGEVKTFVEPVDREDYQGGYSYHWCTSHDPDFDLPPMASSSLQRDIDEYGKRYLFVNSEWKCMAGGRIRIQELCTYYKIPFDNLVAVYKRKNGYLR